MSTHFNVAELRAKLNEIKGKNNRSNSDYLKKFWYPPEWNPTLKERSVVRILPGIIDVASGERKPWFSETRLHKINGKNLHSPSKIGKPCPMTEYIRALWATQDPDNIEVARSIKGKKRFYMNIIVREHEVEDEQTGEKKIVKNSGPLIYSCGIKVFEKILNTMIDDDYGDITDLQKGYDFVIQRESQGEYPNYDNSKPVKNHSAAGSDSEIEEWMGNLHDLQGLITYKSYEELKQEVDMFRGIQSGDVGSSEAANSDTTMSSTSTNDSSNNDSSDEDEENEFMKRLKEMGVGNLDN